MNNAISLTQIHQKSLVDINSLLNPAGWMNASLGRYNCFFGRDAILAALELLPYMPEVAASTLTMLKNTQGKEFSPKKEEEPGKIVHEYRVQKDEEYEKWVAKGWDFPSYASVDSTLLYLLLAQKYVIETQDEAFIYDLKDSFIEAIKWIISHSDPKTGFIRTVRQNPNGMLNQNWIDAPDSLSYKDGTVPDFTKFPVSYIEIQAQLLEVSKNIEILFHGLEHEENAIIDIMKDIAKQAKANFHRYFYMEDERYFAPAIDSQYKKFEKITSTPDYLLYCNAVSIEDAIIISERLFKEDIMTPYGIRILSTNDALFDYKAYQKGTIWPHDNWIFYEGLRNYGLFDKAEDLKKCIMNAVSEIDCIPEFYSVDKDNQIQINPLATKVQAWSCAGVYAMVNGQEYSKILIGQNNEAVVK